MRWKGNGPEHDMWYNISNLDNAGELVRQYEEELATTN